MSWKQSERDAGISLAWFGVGALYCFLLVHQGGAWGGLLGLGALVAGWCGGRRAERAFGESP